MSLCLVCNLELDGEASGIHEFADGQKAHMDCLKCSTCSTSMQPGEVWSSTCNDCVATAIKTTKSSSKKKKKKRALELEAAASKPVFNEDMSESVQQADEPTVAAEGEIASATAEKEDVSVVAEVEEDAHVVSGKEEDVQAMTSEEAAPVLAGDEVAPFAAEEEVAPVVIAEEEAAPVVIAEEEAAPVAIAEEEVAPIAIAEEEAAPIAIAEEEAAPIAIAEEEAAPVAIAEEEAVPVVIVEEETAPVAIAEEEAAPVAIAEEEVAPFAAEEVPPVAIAEEELAPMDDDKQASADVIEEQAAPVDVVEEQLPLIEDQSVVVAMQVDTIVIEEQAVAAEEQTNPFVVDEQLVEDQLAPVPVEDPTPSTIEQTSASSESKSISLNLSAPSRDEFETILASPSPPVVAALPLQAENQEDQDEAPSFLQDSIASLPQQQPSFLQHESPIKLYSEQASDIFDYQQQQQPLDEISTVRYSFHSFNNNQSSIEGEDGHNDSMQSTSSAAVAVDDPVTLNALTNAVARELVFLPQFKDDDDDNGPSRSNSQSWVYPPAHTGVPPVHISVVDPDNVWTFMERNITERIAMSNEGGMKRCIFARSGSLKPHAPQMPMVYLLLIRCETLQSYNTTFRARVRAFVDEMQRTRQNSEFLLVGIESTLESKRVYQELMSQDVQQQNDAMAARIFTCNISDPHVTPNMEGQWGRLVMRIAQCVHSAANSRMPPLVDSAFQSSPQQCVNGVEDFNFLEYLQRTERQAFALLQIDRFADACALYRRLQTEFSEIKRLARNHQVGRMLTRQKMDCTLLLFPQSRSKHEEDQMRAALSPSRIFDVHRLPFAELIVGCTISSLQLEFYLFSRIILCELAVNDAAQAVMTGMDFLRHAQLELKFEYPSEHTLIDVWMVSASLEIVSAGHACAAEFPLHPQLRVKLCLVQAIILERAVAALDRISVRETGVQHAFRAPELALHWKHLEIVGMPTALKSALFSSSKAFSSIYQRLLEASAAHFVGGGRFRFAAALTFRRALLLEQTAASGGGDGGESQTLFRDSSRWWSGKQRTELSEFGLAEDHFVRHDHWPSLVCESVPASELTVEEMRLVFPLSRRIKLAKRIVETKCLLPVVVTLTTAESITIHGEWVLKEVLDVLGGSVEKIVLVCQTASGGGDTAHKINLMLDCTHSDNKEKVVRLEENPAPGEYFPSKAFVWIHARPYECFVDHNNNAGSVVVVPPAPFPYRLELENSSFLTCGVRTAQQLEANDCIQEINLLLVPLKGGDALQQVDAVLLHASPGVVFVQDTFTFTGARHTIRLLVRQKLIPHDSDLGRFTVCLHLPDLPPQEFPFELPFRLPLQVVHSVCFVPKMDNAALSFEFEPSQEELPCQMLAFSLTSIRPSMIRTTPPNELFPVAIHHDHPAMHLSFMLQELEEIVPPQFAITALFFFSAQVELEVESGARKIVLNWSVPLLIERGDVVVTPNWHQAGFINTVPPLVSVRLMDREEDLTGVEESSIMIEL